jgi:hypothetical protein
MVSSILDAAAAITAAQELQAAATVVVNFAEIIEYNFCLRTAESVTSAPLKLAQTAALSNSQRN